MEFIKLLASLFLVSVPFAISVSISSEIFSQCMIEKSSYYTKISDQNIHTSNSSLWLNSTSKPLLLVTPFHESEIQATVLCSRKLGLQVRVKSGRHDYEGLSYLCKTPFIIIDLFDLRYIEVNLADETAWVQSGATLGELYYSIAKKSGVHGFPGGLCPTVGIGGHLSGGGFGTLIRKHGLAADNVIDARFIDVNGRILDRTMGEDLFWAIRGGGGSSFGVIVSWKIKLVQVPKIVTGFTVHKTLATRAGSLVHRWQYIADKFHEDLFIRVINQYVGIGNQKTVQASFQSLFLGGIDRLMPLMKLGLQAKDCIEMSWIQSAQYFAGFQIGQPSDVLLSKNPLWKMNFKTKSDFVKYPIPKPGLQGIWEGFRQEQNVYMILDPYGGRMNEISQYETPFPHRKGNLFNMQYIVKWDGSRVEETNKHINWMRMLYIFMGPYVSRSPRGAYINYKDLDLGANKEDNTSYVEASAWGTRYFKGNFKRLAQVKSKVDPDNFFRNEQSIPPLPSLFAITVV
ncbi:inactive tetrahydrocannabinolic acid synthase-like [Pyrus ussuriensis x Pyrus communis]|uniref:Inactive tetrahydrocannabinolic acid synthase-like n=1 Tax=Pyrus ussuriensis x Pyrus communis TaxID=2448454 RepID=A0A5N5IF92_9ROSA|nr:inactive tetrahydrocannabinolic acid synthase-like [Pyrus ussuriensis x Pyrus communis]